MPELHFENVPAGPFVGLDAIRQAYADQPPADTIQLLGIQENDEHTSPPRSPGRTAAPAGCCSSTSAARSGA